jgi:hypothetical protein
MQDPRSVIVIRMAVLVAVPLNRVSDKSLQPPQQWGLSGRKLVMVPSAVISAVKLNEYVQCRPLSPAPPSNIAPPENAPPVC